MGILASTTSITGLVGVVPNLIFIETDDTIATITTAGYLTHYVQAQRINVAGYEMALVSSTIAGVTTVYWLQVSITGLPPNLVYSLIAPPQAGNAIFAGNVQAGSNGVAGALISYPATVNTGHLTFFATSQGGNFASSVTNAAFGQATAITIPDPVNAVGRLLIAATATPFVANHSIVASGTGGLVADAGYQLKTVAQAAVAGGAAAQTVVDAFCTAASMVTASWNDTTNAVTIQKVAAGAGSFVVTSSADPGASHINYIITKV